MKKIVRMKTRDVAFQFRMGAGFAGDVNRVHPFQVEADLQDATSPVTAFGQAVLLNATGTGVRHIVAADQSDATAVAAFGIAIRPYPVQQAQATTDFAPATFGNGAPPAAGIIDVLKQGYIMVKVNGTPKKGDAVYVWAAATAAPHVLGGFEAAASAGNTVKLSNCYFNGAPDANGVVELAFNL